MAQRRQTYFWLLTLLTEHQFLGRVMMNFMSAVTDAHTTSTSSWEDEKGAQSLQVRVCMRTSSARLDLMLCSPACHCGCPRLPGPNSAAATKSGSKKLTLAGLSDVLAGHIGGG